MARTTAGTRTPANMRTPAGTRTAITGSITAPSSISGLSLWFKADVIAGLNDGDAISTWLDSSGNGLNATQTATARPLYKTNILNSLPIARFDGSNDRMDIAGSPSVASIFVVSNWTGASVFPSDFRGMFGRAAGGRSVLFGRNAEKNIGSALTGATTNVRVNGSASGSVKSFIPLTSFKISYTDTATPIIGESGWYIASGDSNNLYWQGDIAEVIVYSTQLTNVQRAGVEGYLCNKYGIPVPNNRRG